MPVPLAEQMYRYIMGQGSGFRGLLDTYTGATAAYSVRKLSSTYTGDVLRVRRSSDDTEQDIGFNASNELDTAALLAFVGTGGTDNGFVTKWYDQSGNSNDAINADASEQPLVVSGGSVVIENDKAAIDFDGVDDGFAFTALALGDMLISSVQKIDGTTSGIYNGSSDYLRRRSSNYRSRIDFVTQDFLSGTFGQQTLVSFERSGSSLEFYEDGTSLGTATTSATFDIDEIGGGQVAFPFDGTIQEIIIFNSDQSSNRTGIETNINDHFDIYTP